MSGERGELAQGYSGKDWDARGAPARLADTASRKAERVRSLLAVRTASPSQTPIERRGVGVPTAVRFATTADPTAWTTIGAGRPLVDALLDAVADGMDRMALGWPERPGSAFTLAALALRDARSSGHLAHATLAVWPWRGGLTRAARSILVHPGDVATAAARAVTDWENEVAWTRDGLAHRSLDMLELRLRDLVSQNAPPRTRGRSAGIDVVVRSPTLLETTVTFPPPPEQPGATFAADPDQILRRVRDHTHIGDSGGALDRYLDDDGDPLRTPFGVFGVPPLPTREALRRLLAHPRFAARGLDAIVVDLTRNGRSEISEAWGARLEILLSALVHVPGRRPPVFALCEDAFTLKRATGALRAASGQTKPRRRPPREVGAFLSEPGMLGVPAELPAKLPPITFQADIKDASLAVIRRDLVTLGRRMHEDGDGVGIRGVSEVLSFLRRAASLPIGLDEARSVVDVLYDGDDDVDASVRAMFRPMMALAPLAAAADLSPAFAGEARRLIDVMSAKFDTWAGETPVSAKLTELLADETWNRPTTLVTLPGRRVADILAGSDRAVGWQCRIGDHRMLSAGGAASFERLVVVGPTPQAVRALLVAAASPERVLLLGDAAGVALLAGELAPLDRIPAFAAVAERARALGTALRRGGADERIDIAEAEFKLAAIPTETEIDLTHEGGAYHGDLVMLSTARGRRIAYRPNSDVLVFSAGEVRPFERVAAREVQCGQDVLVLDATVREPIRRALAASRKSTEHLALYHAAIGRIRDGTDGVGVANKARTILCRMRGIDPSVDDREIPNISRWLNADLAPDTGQGTRQPRAARDWPRFRLFMRSVGVDDATAELYWRGAIVPTRSYRSQEGHQFNQRVVQFVLDPEGVAAGGGGGAPCRGSGNSSSTRWTRSWRLNG
jgi:hypothetical protein